MRQILTILLALPLFMGCASSRRAAYEPMRSATADSTATVRISADTVWLRDSVSVDTRATGDTVYRTVYRERTRWRVRERHDTIVVARRDSVWLRQRGAEGQDGDGRSPWKVAGGMLAFALAAGAWMLWSRRGSLWK